MTHPADFAAGFAAVKEEIAGMGFDAARDKFNLDNPVGHNFSSTNARMYAEGGLQALVEALA
jgi:hypothetical protein